MMPAPQSSHHHWPLKETHGRWRLAVAALALGVTGVASAHPLPVATPDVALENAVEQEPVQFALTLPLRNQAELDQLLSDLYTPGSPNFHHFLSSEEFDSRFAPTQEQYNALKALAAQQGFQIVGEQEGRTLLDVSAPAATVRSVFRTQMEWRLSGDGKRYLAPQGEADLPFTMMAMSADVVGLNAHPLSTHLRGLRPAAAPHSGTGGGGSYAPADIKTAYNVTGVPAQGMPVAIYELSSANYADTSTYASQFGLHNPKLTQIKVDGGTTDKSGSTEVMLDIEMVMAISNPASMFIYTAPNGGSGPYDLWAKIASDNKAGEVSTSWGLAEQYLGSSGRAAENTQFTKMATEGMAVFAAAGDSAAYDNGSTLSVDDPASQPEVTGVGGTHLTTTSSQVYSSESVWHTSSSEGGGGGISKYWARPSYQSGVTFHGTTGQYSTSKRNVPDVALDADPSTGYTIYDSQGGGWGIVGGTSAAAPLWAGFWSVVDKGRKNKGKSPLRMGFGNPPLYTLGKNATSYAADFHDVKTGTNAHFHAVAGYDTATGWGSFNASKLYADLLKQ